MHDPWAIAPPPPLPAKADGMRLAAATCALTLVCACSGAPEEEWSGTLEDRDGVVWINNPATLPEDAHPPFGLELEQTFGAESAPEDALLQFVTSVAVDGVGNVYVVDRFADRLLAFDPDGQLLWAAGQVGQGPGDVQNVLSLAWDGADLLYVDNQSGGQVDTWTTAGEFVATQRLSDFGIAQGYVVGLPDPNTIVLRAYSRADGDGAIIHVFKIGDRWTRTTEFFARGGRVPESPERGPWATVKVRLKGDSVWVGNRLQYEVREYSLDGVLRRVIAREHAPLIPYFVYKGTGFGLGEFEPPLWLSAEHGLIPRYWLVGIEDVEEFKRLWDEFLASGSRDPTAQEFDSAIDLVDAEGRVLDSLPIGGYFHESIGTLETIGPDGRLYTSVYEPYPHVRRYRVVLPGEAGQ